MKKLFLLFHILYTQCLTLSAQISYPQCKEIYNQSFVNRILDIDHFGLFFQDSIGRIWGGVHGGSLMMFNGETFTPHNSAPQIYGIRCVLRLNSEEYLIGTHKGLYHFSLRTLRTKSIPTLDNDEITDITRLNNREILIATNHSLFKLLPPGFSAVKIYQQKGKALLAQQLQLPDQTLILRTNTQTFYHFDARDNSYCELKNISFRKNSEIPISMTYRNNLLWIGTDLGLIRYDWNKKESTRIKMMEGISVKALLAEEMKKLWIGTNNGLYETDLNLSEYKHYRHIIGNKKSLLNNNIWSIFKDQNGNLWLGTDSGISFMSTDSPIRYLSWNDIVSSTEGNRILTIFHDSHNIYWLGGNNGLGYYDANTQESIFFRMQGEMRIPNNFIRHIYEDYWGNIWISTDLGPARFNRKTKKFQTYNISQGSNHATWTYGITQDCQGNYWLATCSGGIFCVKPSYFSGQESPVVNYSLDSTQGIPSNYCQGILKDSTGNLWINANSYIYRISTIRQTQNPLSILPLQTKTKLVYDKNGYLWGSGKSFLFRINEKNLHTDTIKLSHYTEKYGNIQDLTICKDNLWFLTSQGIGFIHLKTLRFQHLMDVETGQYSCCYYDETVHSIWLGGIDGCTVIQPDKCLEKLPTVSPFSLISEIYVNGYPITASQPLDGKTILTEAAPYCNSLTLDSKENNLIFRLSMNSIPQKDECQSGYYYRIKNLDTNWKPINTQKPLAEYPYLPYGKYTFEIGHKLINSETVQIVRTVKILIKTPWYYSTWFRFMSVTILLLLGSAWLYNYKIKIRLHLAEMERQRILTSSRDKIEFLTNMSHELKTPLSLILGPINKLLSSTTSETNRLLLQTMQKNALKLNAQVMQILNLDEKVGEQSVNKTSIEAVEFVQSIVLAQKESFKQKNISLIFHTGTGPTYIEADPLKLEVVLNNLLSNAYKFTHENGTVRVSVSVTDIHEKSELAFSVSDNGIGIPPHELPHIFERYYQSEQNKSVNPNGSGIGLSVVKKYIDAHQGNIVVESLPGKGSIFTVRIPVTRQSKPERTDSSHEPPYPKEKMINVLLVEDNIDIANFIAENLSGMKCTVAHNGKTGLALALACKPDIIVTDLMMPIMDGQEMLRLLKRNQELKTIPTILLTAKDDEQTKLNAYNNGADAFLSKPFDVELLIAQIRQILQNRATLALKIKEADKPEELPEVKMLGKQDLIDEKVLAEITRTIEEHLEDTDLNVTKLAELLGTNTKQVYRKVKLLTGMTVVEYIRSIRLKKAAMLLEQKCFSVSEVMYAVGFSNPSYFAKCFQNKYGTTPKEYVEKA